MRHHANSTPNNMQPLEPRWLMSTLTDLSEGITASRLDSQIVVEIDAGYLDDLVTIEFATTPDNTYAFTWQLVEEAAPNAVANFFAYVNSGRYDDSYVHRSARTQTGDPFVIQGGGFTLDDAGTLGAIQTFPPIENQFQLSNTRGTVAMARLSGDPDSATSQWFVNLNDNTFLDNDSGDGFTAFARVLDGMDDADAIGALPRYNLRNTFASILDDGDPETPLSEEDQRIIGAASEVPLDRPATSSEPLQIDDFVRTTDHRIWSDTKTLEILATSDPGLAAEITNGSLVLDVAQDVPAGDYTVTLRVSDDSGNAAEFDVPVTLEVPEGVVDRLLFYNDSAFDDGPGANASDDDAIATDKAALLPGDTARFEHISSHDAGITGIMVDIGGLNGTLTASDFAIRIGRDTDLITWADGPAPAEIAVRTGEGLAGTDRVTLIWPEGTLVDTWVEVTVLPTASTGLAEADVFYFGSAPGDIGNASTFEVNSLDAASVRDNPRSVFNPVDVTSPYDFNRDTFVNALDYAVARDNATSLFNRLPNIAPEPGGLAVSQIDTQRLAAAIAQQDARLRPVPVLDDTDDLFADLA